MPKKSRRPYEFGYEDYLVWARWLGTWFVSHSSDPDYPSHLTADYPGVVVDFESALIDYTAKKEANSGKSKLYESASKDVYDKLVVIKIALPTVAEEPDVLAEFGLSEPLSRDREDLYVRIQVVLGRWAVVSGDPIYAPLVADFNDLIALNTAFVSAHNIYYAAYHAMQQAQNEVVETREALHVLERKIFTWYRSRYPKGTEEFWTGSSWGAVGGGSGESSTGWNKKPVGKLTKATVPLNGILAGCEPYTGADRFDIRITWAKKNQPVPAMPLVDSYTDVMQPVYLDEQNFPLEKGYVYYEWIRARKNNEVSDWSDVVGILWE